METPFLSESSVWASLNIVYNNFFLQNMSFLTCRANLLAAAACSDTIDLSLSIRSKIIEYKGI